jgi:hypothetical protein
VRSAAITSRAEPCQIAGDDLDAVERRLADRLSAVSS